MHCMVDSLLHSHPPSLVVLQEMSVIQSIRHRLEEREETLSPAASRSRNACRDLPEDPSTIRTEFQRDRDRIVHSKSFRRLKHKTQVFIAPTGDHYVTRLTHTLEVAQIARTIARALNLNEDLTEAIGLGHDIGHTPFGHTGEDEMSKLYRDGFRHAEQSLRIVEVLEKERQGLNLTREVRQGIVSHSKPRGAFLDSLPEGGISLEAQVVRISDAIAYINHDIADAFRAGLLLERELPNDLIEILGDRHSKRIDTMVTDVIRTSWPVSSGEYGDGNLKVSMSSEIGDALIRLREFMFKRVYVEKDGSNEGDTARQIVRLLYEYYDHNRDLIPTEYRDDDRAVVDYVAGMTDLYAIRKAEEIDPGIASIFLEPRQ